MSGRLESIVITGVGLTTGLGASGDQTWRGILQGRSAMRPMSALESPVPPGTDGGQAVDLPPDFGPNLPREARYLRWTLAAAMRDAGVAEGALPCEAARCACVLGTTLHGMRGAGRFLRTKDVTELQGFLAGDVLATACAGAAFTGLAATVCSACSSSLGSVALGVTLLQTGAADLVIAGGYDTISEYVYGGFNSLRLVADGPLRPFATGRRGMKLAEGYGIVVLERAGDAAARGAKPLAAILGWGESADAHHLTQPHPTGEGAARAIEAALAHAGLTAADIDLVAAHATGTPDNDAGEYAAFSRVFGTQLPRVPVVAFKSHLGHTLGAAGAVELILSAFALRDQIVPACANVTDAEVEFADLRLATGSPQPAKIRATLNTSLGFGGANTCIVLGPAPAPAAAAARPRLVRTPQRAVYITGIGVVLPGIIGNDALLARLAAGGEPAWDHESGPLPEGDFEGLLAARRTRRMSNYVKMTLAAATLACRDAGIADVPSFAQTCAAVLGSMHGSANFSETYYAQIVNEGLSAANPSLFAEGVPNAAAAQLSLMLSLKGACQTVIGTRTSGLDALALAAARIRSGAWDRAIVGAGEEHSELISDSYRQCGMGARKGCAPFSGESGFVAGPGAITFILESGEAVASRGGRIRGRVDLTAACRGIRAEAPRSARRILDALDGPANVLSSACGAWIDRAEAAALRGHRGVRTVSAMYGHVAETYSATALAGVAATLLSGKLPRLLGGAWENREAKAASGEEQVDSFAVLCTDFTGCVSGARLTRM